MSGEQTNSDVNVLNVSGGQSADIGVSMAEQAAADAAAAAAADPNSAASLGVTEAQYAKFYNAETKQYNWQAHATEAEFRAKQAAAGTPEPDDKATAQQAAPNTEAEAETIISKAGLKIETLEDQILDTGDIDEAAYAALEGIGFPKTMVADYIDSIKDRGARQVEAVLTAFGGENNLDRVKLYAQDNYTMEEMEDLDRKLSDPKTMQATVDMLRHQAGVVPGSTGAPVSSPNAFGGSADGVKGYDSEAQMVSDMRNPRYRTDPTFRQEVTRKVAAATFGPSNPRAHSGGL